MHQLGAYSTIECKCKSKPICLPIWPYDLVRSRKLKCLGLVFCYQAPSLGLALVGRYRYNAEGDFERIEVGSGLDNFSTGPFCKLLDRLKAFSRPTLSITARCTGFNTFIISVMPYTISYFGLTTADLNRLRQAAAKFILRRHWVEAEILPYVLRYLGIATLLDPALSATVAATGLYLREGNMALSK